MTPLLINLGLVQATLGSYQGHQLVNLLVVAVGGMGCDIHQKVIILFHAFPGYNVAFGSCFGCFLQSQSWDLASKLLIPSALWMLVFHFGCRPFQATAASSCTLL